MLVTKYKHTNISNNTIVIIIKNKEHTCSITNDNKEKALNHIDRDLKQHYQLQYKKLSAYKLLYEQLLRNFSKIKNSIYKINFLANYYLKTRQDAQLLRRSRK